MKKIFFLIIINFSFLCLCAQDLDKPTEEIEVVKAYKPILADALKINFKPEIVQNDKLNLQYTYELNDVYMPVSIVPPDLKPLAFSPPKSVELKSKLGYLQMAYGIKNNLTLDGGAQYQYNKNSWLALHTNIQNVVFEKLYLQQAKVSLTNETELNNNIAVWGNISFKDIKTNALPNLDESLWYYRIKQKNISLSANIYKPFQPRDKWRYNFNNFCNINNASNYNHAAKGIWYNNETQFVYTLKKKFELGLQSIFHYNSFTKDSENNTSNNLLSIGPKLRIIRDNGKITLGAFLGMINKKSEILHDVAIEQWVIPQYLNVTLAWNKSLLNNNWNNINQFNYLVSPENFNMLHGTKQNLSLALSGSYKSIDYNITFDQNIYKNYALLNKRNIGFDIDYNSKFISNVFAINIAKHFSTKGHLTNTFRFYNYKGEQITKGYYLPNTTYDMNLFLPIKDKWLLKTNIFASNSFYSKSFDITKKEKGILDLNLGIEYQYNKWGSVFLESKNIANSNYIIWNRVQRFGRLISGGIKVEW